MGMWIIWSPTERDAEEAEQILRETGGPEGVGEIRRHGKQLAVTFTGHTSTTTPANAGTLKQLLGDGFWVAWINDVEFGFV